MKNIDNGLALIDEKCPAFRLSRALNQLMTRFQIDGVQLSKHTGIPVTTVNRLRKGDKTSNPTLTTLVPLADFFSISVSELIGDTQSTYPNGLYKVESTQLNLIPIISWEEAVNWPTNTTPIHSKISTEHTYSKNAFALTVIESDWINLLIGTTLIIEPSAAPLARDYIIVLKKGQLLPTVKQALFDDGQMYLKPVVSGYNTIAFTNEYKVLGVVTELRKNLRL